MRIVFIGLLITLCGCMDFSKNADELFAEGDYKGARVQYEKALISEPNNEILHYNLARSLEELEEYKDAIREFTWVVRNSANPSRAFQGRARCYWKDGDFEAAEMDFTNAIKITEDNFDAYLGRGRVRIKLFKFLSAYEDLNNALNVKPDDMQATYYRAFASAQSGAILFAIGDFNRVIENDPINIEAIHNRGICFQRMGWYKSAIRDFNEVLILTGNTRKESLWRRGYCLFVTGNKEKGCLDMEKATEYGYEGWPDYRIICKGT